MTTSSGLNSNPNKQLHSVSLAFSLGEKLGGLCLDWGLNLLKLEQPFWRPELSEDGGGDFIAIARAQSVGGDV